MFEFDLKAKLIGHNGQDSQIRVNYIDQQEKNNNLGREYIKICPQMMLNAKLILSPHNRYV
jgi:hypothetical protein